MRRQSHRSAADQGEAATSLGMEFLAPRLGKLLQSTSSKFVCICGRAGNQQIFHDIRLGVLKSVVKLLLAAGPALQSKNNYFILSPLAGTTTCLTPKWRELGPKGEIPEDSPSKISPGLQKLSRSCFASIKVFPLMLYWTLSSAQSKFTYEFLIAHGRWQINSQMLMI